MLNEKDHEELRLLLSAAESVKPKLLSLLALGPDALEAHAYAIKARVKTFDSAVIKINDKRSKGVTDYAPSKLTDVIGVRVLCLWPDDISIVLERLIRTIHDISKTGLSSFAGKTIAEIVTEVIVYKATNSPAVYDVIGKQLVTWLLDHGRASDCVRVEDSPKDRPYSSVHLVVWCQAFSAGTWVRVPVEFQVRTSLEDVWSEVDHRLRYKKRSREIEERIEKVGNDLLDQLKGQLDIAASTVTSARSLFTPAPPNPSASLARVVPDPDPSIRWGTRHASPEQKLSAVGLSEALDAFYPEFEAATDRAAEIWDQRLDGLIEDVRAAISARSADPSTDEGDETDWLFASRMELAQLLLWRARLERGETHQDAELLKHIGELTEACLKTYLELINSKKFEHSALLWFRFGNALLDLKGDFEQAHVYLKRAHAEMGTDATVPGTPLSIAIPRLFAYAIWRVQNQQYLRSIKQFGMQSAAAEHSHEAIHEALTVMRPLLAAIDEVEATGPFWDAKAERVRVANNLLSYAWYYGLMGARAKGIDVPSQDELADAVLEAIARNLIQAAYDTLVADVGSGDDVKPIHRIHTLATTAFILKDERAAGHVTDLQARLAQLESEGNLVEADASQMLDDMKVLEPRKG